MPIPPELLERYLEYQNDEKAFLARKAHFLESMGEMPDKLGDRTLARLREEERALRVRRDAIAAETKEGLGLDLD